jgi:hypothetical protein
MDDPGLIGPKLDIALEDEYHAEAMYNAVIDEFGEVRPFSNIVAAEGRHADLLLRIYDKYDLEAPANAYTDAGFDFASPQEAGQAALEAEIANAELYDELLEDVGDSDVIAVFEQLQWASRERHLPALQGYVSGGGSGGGQAGKGKRHRRGRR